MVNSLIFQATNITMLNTHLETTIARTIVKLYAPEYFEFDSILLPQESLSPQS